MTQLTLTGAASHYRCEVLDVSPSTNTECLSRADLGDPGDLWIMAHEQSKGRGSRGRDWQSIAGNLHASVLLRNPCTTQFLSQLTFVAVLAAHKAVADYLGNPADALQVKWPNDLLLNRKKLGGILLESRSTQSENVVVIGFGINLAGHPPDTPYPATRLAEAGVTIAPEAFLVTLAERFAQLRDTWSAAENFEAIRERWLTAAAGLGEAIVIRIPGKKDRTGKFAGIDADGCLMLEGNDGGMQRISSADIFFTPTGSEPQDS